MSADAWAVLTITWAVPYLVFSAVVYAAGWRRKMKFIWWLKHWATWHIFDFECPFCIAELLDEMPRGRW